MPLDKRSGKSLRFSDPEVCKYALAGLCPYGLFKNTRSDLGAHLWRLLTAVCCWASWLRSLSSRHAVLLCSALAAGWRLDGVRGLRRQRGQTYYLLFVCLAF